MVLMTDPLYAYREVLINQPDLILVDIGLSGNGALRLIQRIYASEPHLLARTVIMADNSNKPVVKAITDHGTAGIVIKPLNSDRLLSIIKSVILRSSYPENQRRSSNNIPVAD